MSGCFCCLDEMGCLFVFFIVDGEVVDGFEGDILMVVMFILGCVLCDSEFGDGCCLGFCLMGVCQDCWVWIVEGECLCVCIMVVVNGFFIFIY